MSIKMPPRHHGIEEGNGLRLGRRVPGMESPGFEEVGDCVRRESAKESALIHLDHAARGGTDFALDLIARPIHGRYVAQIVGDRQVTGTEAVRCDDLLQACLHAHDAADVDEGAR